jgi:hypothetical protein
MFVVLTAPSAVLLSWTAHGDITIESPNMRFLDAFFQVLFNLNSCLNFMLYSVSSSKFRRAFMSICGKESTGRNKTLSKSKNTTISNVSKSSSSSSKQNPQAVK